MKAYYIFFGQVVKAEVLSVLPGARTYLWQGYNYQVVFELEGEVHFAKTIEGVIVSPNAYPDNRYLENRNLDIYVLGNHPKWVSIKGKNYLIWLGAGMLIFGIVAMLL